MSEMKMANPYAKPDGTWWWYDAEMDEHGPYPTQRAALRTLLDYMDWLDNGPTLWQRLWWPVRYTWWPKFLEMLRA